MNTKNIYIDWANVKDDLPRDFHRHTHLSWWYSCMSALSVSRTFLGMKCILVNTLSCLDILYMYIHFRPMMITENDRNYQKKTKDLIDKFTLGGKLYAN